MVKKLSELDTPPDVVDRIHNARMAELDERIRIANGETKRLQEEQRQRIEYERRQVEQEKHDHRHDLALMILNIFMWMFFWRAIFNMGRK